MRSCERGASERASEARASDSAHLENEFEVSIGMGGEEDIFVKRSTHHFQYEGECKIADLSDTCLEKNFTDNMRGVSLDVYMFCSSIIPVRRSPTPASRSSRPRPQALMLHPSSERRVRLRGWLILPAGCHSDGEQFLKHETATHATRPEEYSPFPPSSVPKLTRSPEFSSLSVADRME